MSACDYPEGYYLISAYDVTPGCPDSSHHTQKSLPPALKSLTVLLSSLAILIALIGIIHFYLLYNGALLIAEAKINECKNLFTINKCHRPVPLVKEQCLKWEFCMSKNAAHEAMVHINIFTEIGMVFDSVIGSLSYGTCLKLSIFLIVPYAIYKAINKH